jgi:hypothetical protein
VAASGETITYGALASIAGLSISRPPDRRELIRILGAICAEERGRGAPMLCAVVVRGDTGRPGKGFFTVARALGLSTEIDEQAFFAAELAKVHDWYHGRPCPRA